MKQVNYNPQSVNKFIPKMKKEQDKVEEMLKEKSSSEAAEKAVTRATQEIVENVVKDAVNNIDYMQILATMNKAMITVPQPQSQEPEGNIIPDDIVPAEEMVLDERIGFDELVAEWDNLIAQEQEFVEPEIFALKIDLLKRIISAAETRAANSNDPEDTKTLNIWKCKRFILLQNYATALLHDYNQQLNEGTASFTNWPFESEADITFHINGSTGFKIAGSPFEEYFCNQPHAMMHTYYENPEDPVHSELIIEFSLTGNSPISLSDFWGQSVFNGSASNGYNHFIDCQDLSAVVAFRGETMGMGGGLVPWYPNPDPEMEYYYNQSMIAFYRAQIEAIQAQMNNGVGGPGWISQLRLLIAEHQNRINEYCVDFINTLEVDENPVEGLTPTFPSQSPSESIPKNGEELEVFYGEYLNKYNSVYGGGHIQDELQHFNGEDITVDRIDVYMEQLDNLEVDAGDPIKLEQMLLLTLIIAAIRLEDRQSAKFWINKLNVLLGDDGSQRGNAKQTDKDRSPVRKSN